MIQPRSQAVQSAWSTDCHIVPNDESQHSPPPRHRHVFVIFGPAGSGKTTVARHLSEAFGFKYIEGDEHHSKASIAKMTAGIALGDADRWDWLIKLREAAVFSFDREQAKGVVMTCSALKQKYRDVIRIASINDSGVRIHFLHLTAARDILLSRITSRQDHYMSAAMLDSQLQDLEAVGRREKDICVVDVSASRQQIEVDVERLVQQIMCS